VPPVAHLMRTPSRCPGAWASGSPASARAHASDASAARAAASAARLFEHDDVRVAKHSVVHDLARHVLVDLRRRTRWVSGAQERGALRLGRPRAGLKACGPRPRQRPRRGRRGAQSGRGAPGLARQGEPSPRRPATQRFARGARLSRACVRQQRQPGAARTPSPRSMYFTATSSPVALSRSRRASPKLPLPKSFT
jgi:hypothetical protein